VIQKYSQKSGDFTKEESALFFDELREAKKKHSALEYNESKKKKRNTDVYWTSYSEKDSQELKKWYDLIKDDPAWIENKDELNPVETLFREEWNKDGLEQYQDLLKSIKKCSTQKMVASHIPNDLISKDLIKNLGLEHCIDKKQVLNIELHIANLVKDQCEITWRRAVLYCHDEVQKLLHDHRKKWMENKSYFSEETFKKELERLCKEANLDIPEDVKNDIYNSYTSLQEHTNCLPKENNNDKETD
jgi:hypothetical protein